MILLLLGGCRGLDRKQYDHRQLGRLQCECRLQCCKGSCHAPFVDGGAGDDGAADGWIVDSSGLSSSASTSTSSSGGGEGGGGCFIATAAFGSDMESHVKILRDFRDRFLITNPIGHAFLDFYYAYSPPVTGFIAKNDSLGALVQWRLIPLVAVSWMTLQIGSAPTLACILIMFTGLVYIVGIRRKYKK